MSNLTIYIALILFCIILFLLFLKSFISQMIIRKKIIKEREPLNALLEESKRYDMDLTEMYLYICKAVVQKSNVKLKKRDEYFDRVSDQLYFMEHSTFTKLASRLILIIKGCASLVASVLVVVLISMGIYEYETSQLRHPTGDLGVELDLERNFIESVNAYVISRKYSSKSDFTFPQLDEEAVVPRQFVVERPELNVKNAEQLSDALAYYMASFKEDILIVYSGVDTDYKALADETIKLLIERHRYIERFREDITLKVGNYNGTTVVIVNVEYKLTEEQHSLTLGRVDQIVAAMPNGLSNVEKVKYFNDYIVTHTQYKMKTKANRHTPYSILFNGEGTCEGYAMTMLLLLEAVGIEAKFITGDAGEPHAWNMVKLNDEWYHLDVTWNDPAPDQGDRIFYNYFLISDESISKTHKWDRNQFPKSAQENYKE